jgi:predicted O-methyltransferase YrrM
VYLAGLLAPADPALAAALSAAEAAGLPPSRVSAMQGILRMLLARMQRARRILEIGTLGGYSTLWFARGLQPDGRIITLELDPRHAEVAQANFVRAGVSHQIELRLGPALRTLAALRAAAADPFDVIFIDADKPNTSRYFEYALDLARPGTLIVVDNVVRDGAIADAASADASVQGMQQFLARLAAEARVAATVLQTVGGKGYDGFALAMVLGGSAPFPAPASAGQPVQ